MNIVIVGNKLSQSLTYKQFCISLSYQLHTKHMLILSPLHHNFHPVAPSLHDRLNPYGLDKSFHEKQIIIYIKNNSFPFTDKVKKPSQVQKLQ